LNRSSATIGSDHLRTLLEHSQMRPIHEILNKIRRALQRHIDGAPLEDDLTLLVVQLLDNEGSGAAEEYSIVSRRSAPWFLATPIPFCLAAGR